MAARKTRLDLAIELLEKRAKDLRADPWYMPCGQETEWCLRALKDLRGDRR